MRISWLIAAAGVVALLLPGCAALDAASERGSIRAACEEIDSMVGSLGVTQYGMMSDPAGTKQKLTEAANIADKHSELLPSLAPAFKALRDALPLDPANTTPLERSLFESASADFDRATREYMAVCA